MFHVLFIICDVNCRKPVLGCQFLKTLNNSDIGNSVFQNVMADGFNELLHYFHLFIILIILYSSLAEILVLQSFLHAGLKGTHGHKRGL